MFTPINPTDIEKSPFEMIGKQWMLITAGDSGKLNTMTASWGGVGVLWNKNVVFAFVRPQRFTLEFLNKSEYFSCSFLPEEYRSALTLCGRKSGRDCDKISEAGITPLFDENAPYFEESDTAIICKKLYVQQLNKDSIVDAPVAGNYADDDYHYMFVGEIVKVLKK